MERAESNRLVERREELGRLRDIRARASGGSGAVAAVLGEPGIGKSSLLDAAAAAAPDMRVLRARAAEIEAGYPFGLVRQLIEPVLLGLDDQGRERLFTGPAAHAADVFAPSAAPSPPRPDLELATLGGLYWMLAAVARERPLLLALDDLQWADPPSLRFLLFLLRRIESSPVAVVAALRSGSQTSGPLGELLDDPATTVIEPRPLSADGIGELVERQTGRRARSATVDSLLEITGGNPFFVLSLLEERGGDAEAAASGAPEAVVRSVNRRLASLPEAARELALALAVLGDGSRLFEAGRLAGLDGVEAADAAAALGAAGLVDADAEGFAFSHPIVADAVYRAGVPSERARLHLEAASMLEARSAPVEEVAAQLLRAPAPAPHPRAEAVLAAAADDALSRGAPEIACAYLERALEEPLSARRRADTLLRLGGAQARAGSPAATASLAECVALAGDPERTATATIALARMLYAVGAPKEAVERLGGAARELRPTSPREAARLDEELLSLADVDLANRRFAHTFVELPVASADGDPFSAAHLAVTHLMAAENAATTADLAELAMADDVLLRATQTGSSLFFLLIFALVVADRPDLAARHAEAAAELAGRESSAITFALACWARGLVAVSRGALVEAEAELQIGLDVTVLNDLPVVAQLLLVTFIEVLIQRGDTDRAVPAARAVGLDLEDLDESTQGTVLQVMRGKLRLAEGRTAEGTRDALAAGERLASWGVVNPALYGWHTETALALAGAGQIDEAGALAAEQLRLAEAWGTPRALGAARRTAGLLVGGAEGIERLEQACEVLAGSGAELSRAVVLTDLGAALRRANSRSAARPVLTEALELARVCGAGPLAERAHTELWATGSRPREPLRTGLDSLTPSELRIARLAAGGRSNAEIAQQLFITVKTVEMHLTRTYRKLDLTSRGELSGALPD
jgi:DNA-binding CsgD family transcriptional regulator